MQSSITKSLTLKEILSTLRQHKPELDALGVKNLALFGSYARDSAKPESDIDFLVELETVNYMTLLKVNDYLEKLLQHRIDLIRKGSHLKERFLKSIEKDLIYV